MSVFFIILNVAGIFVPILVACLCSRDRRKIPWKSVGIVLALEILVGAFLVFVSAGRAAVSATATGFGWLMQIAYAGISFALPDWVTPPSSSMNFVTAALLPILFVVPLFDILTYIGVLPFIIKWIGRGISFITRRGRFESFYSVEMMFLGNSEALAVSRLQIERISPVRNVTIAMMSMSCVTASIIGAYTQMVPGQYVIAAIPLNILSALILSSILNPVEIKPEEDFVVHADGSIEHHQDAKLKMQQDELVSCNKEAEKFKKLPFFSYLGNSILSAGKLILIIFANVVAFVALASLIDKIFSLTTLSWLTLENILGVLMFPFAIMLGFDSYQAFDLAQFMGTKLVTNEFVVMGHIASERLVETFSPHFTAVVTVFLTSFANFSTVGIVTGTMKGIANQESNDAIAKQVSRIFLSGILVSLLSAAIVGVFVW